MGVKCSKGKMGVFGGVLGVTGGIAVGAIGMAFTMVAGNKRIKSFLSFLISVNVSYCI